MQNNAEMRVQMCQSRCNKTGARGFFTKACSPCYRTFIASYYIFFILDILALKMNRANSVPIRHCHCSILISSNLQISNFCFDHPENTQPLLTLSTLECHSTFCNCWPHQ
jgi:hypothetical protein